MINLLLLLTAPSQEVIIPDTSISKSLSDSLSFSETLSVTKSIKVYSRTIQQTISFPQSISRQMFYAPKIISQTIKFSDTEYMRFFNGVYVPIPVVTPVLVNYPPEYDAYGYPIKVLKYVKMSSAGGIVILPAPVYENTQRNKSLISVKRTMTGGTRVFVEPNANSGLKYQFVITESKKKELLNFLKASNTKLITITDWKKNTWIAVLITNPVSANSVGNDRVEVALEFEAMGIS